MFGLSEDSGDAPEREFRRNLKAFVKRNRRHPVVGRIFRGRGSSDDDLISAFSDAQKVCMLEADKCDRGRRSREKEFKRLVEATRSSDASNLDREACCSRLHGLERDARNRFYTAEQWIRNALLYSSAQQTLEQARAGMLALKEAVRFFEAANMEIGNRVGYTSDAGEIGPDMQRPRLPADTDRYREILDGKRPAEMVLEAGSLPQPPAVADKATE